MWAECPPSPFSPSRGEKVAEGRMDLDAPVRACFPGGGQAILPIRACGTRGRSGCHAFDAGLSFRAFKVEDRQSCPFARVAPKDRQDCLSSTRGVAPSQIFRAGVRATSAGRAELATAGCRAHRASDVWDIRTDSCDRHAPSPGLRPPPAQAGRGETDRSRGFFLGVRPQRVTKTATGTGSRTPTSMAKGPAKRGSRARAAVKVSLWELFGSWPSVGSPR